MRKLLCRTTAVILALSIVGCDSLPFLGGGGEEEATPESSPSPTAEAPASPTPSPSPTPEPFATPDVPQKPPRVSALIQSSNPEERLSQLERQIGRSGQTQTPTPSTTPELPQGRDPFAVDIPIPPPSESEDGGTSLEGPVVVTQLPSQRVPQVPSIPEIISPPPLPRPDTPRPGPVTPSPPSPRTDTPSPRPGPPSPRTDTPSPNLARAQVPELPKLGELNRPPQVGGTTLVGDVPPIRLTPLQEELINGFRTLDALTDETSKLSEYSTDLSGVSSPIRATDTRRELLLSNRALYRRLEKVLFEYELAERLWNFYGDESEPDALRCSSIPAIEQAINIYGPPTVPSGQLRCVERMELLNAVWARGNNILDAALRDRDFNATSLADAPSLPNAGEPTQLGQLPQIPEFQRPATPPPPRQADVPSLPDTGGPTQLGQPPVVPPLEGSSQPRSIGMGPGPVEPIPEIPSIAVEPRGVPNLPELPVQGPPPQHPSARAPEPIAGGGEEPLAPPPPPPPSTALAEGVKVTGVVEVGNEKQVMLEAPNEATSRYVKVGQRVAGGKVLVKRVDFENGEAIVILEENDIEIRKRIGEEPTVE